MGKSVKLFKNFLIYTVLSLGLAFNSNAVNAMSNQILSENSKVLLKINLWKSSIINDSSIIVISFVVLIFIILVYTFKKIESEKELKNQLKATNDELAALYEEWEASDEELRRQFDEIQLQEKKLADSEARYKLVFNASHEGLWDFNFETKEVYITKEWHGKFIGENVHNEQKIIKKWHSLVHPEDIKKVISLIEELKRGIIDKYTCEYRFKTPQGNYIWIQENAIALRDEAGNIKRIAGSHLNITFRKLHEEKMEYLAYHDSLTGLHNRQALKNKLSKILNEALPGFHNGALLSLGIDNFKLINDTYGHEVGDEVLKEIGQRLKEIEQENVYVGRLGGDEFIVIINDVNDMEQIKNTIYEIQKLFKNKYIVCDREVYLSTSVGVALYPENGTKIDDLIKNADSAMYKAKLLGKSRFMFFDDEMNKEKSDRVYIQDNLREAITSDRFSLHYQPEIELKTGRIVGFEALIRWIDEDHGYINPDRFIRIAEEMGLIVPIGKWVIEKACIFAREINKNRVNKIIVSVNVSTVQLMQEDFVSGFKNIILETEVDPTIIGIEITETSMMDSFQVNAYKIKQLKNMGVKVALDDFGTGYSSLNYLRQLPISTLKIDKSFISDLASDIYGTNLTEGIIMIAHKIGLTVVAEGVESEEQIEKLKICDCDIIQGYHISKPLTEEKASEFIKSVEEKNLSNINGNR